MNVRLRIEETGGGEGGMHGFVRFLEIKILCLLIKKTEKKNHLSLPIMDRYIPVSSIIIINKNVHTKLCILSISI